MAANDIGRKAFARLRSRANLSPSDTREGHLYAPCPRMFVLALALPAQIDEPPFGWTVRKRAPENRLVRFVAFADFEDDIEVMRLTGVG